MLVSLDTVSSCEKAAGDSKQEAALQHVTISIPYCQNARVMQCYKADHVHVSREF
jgi:hypothetical protein